MPNPLESGANTAANPENVDASRALYTDTQPHKSVLQTGVDFALDHTIGSTSGVGKFVSTYAPEALTTLALFTPGKTALALSIGLGAANQVKIGDTLGMQAQEFLAGGTQGFLSKELFNRVGNSKAFGEAMWTIPAKGVVLGSGSRFLDSALTPQNWYDKNGSFQPGQATWNTLSQTFNPGAMALDATVFSVAHAGWSGMNMVTGRALEKSAALRTISVGTTFGATSGVLQEYMNQRKSGHSIDWGEVAKSGLIHAAINGVASAPGGVMGDPVARQYISERVTPKVGETIRNSSLFAGALGSLLTFGVGQTPIVRSFRANESTNTGGPPVEGDESRTHTSTDGVQVTYHEASDGKTATIVTLDASKEFPTQPQPQTQGLPEKLRYSLLDKTTGAEVVGSESEPIILRDAKGDILGGGKAFIVGPSDLSVSVPADQTLRLVIGHGGEQANISISPDSLGKIELINQTNSATPEVGLKELDGSFKPNVSRLDPLAEVLAPHEIERANQIDEMQKSIPQTQLVKLATTPIDESLPLEQQQEARLAQLQAQAELDRLVNIAYGDGAAKKERVLHIITGNPGAGKTSILVEPYAREYGAMVLDSDKIKPLFPEYQEGLGTNAVHVDSAHVIKMALQRAFANGDSIIYPQLGRVHSALGELIEEARNHGYAVGLHTAELPPEKATRRVFDRAEQPPDQDGIRQMVNPRFALQVVGKAPIDVFYSTISQPGKVDMWSHYDTDVPRGQPAKLVNASWLPEAATQGSRALPAVETPSQLAARRAQLVVEALPPPMQLVGFLATTQAITPMEIVGHDTQVQPFSMQTTATPIPQFGSTSRTTTGRTQPQTERTEEKTP